MIRIVAWYLANSWDLCVPAFLVFYLSPSPTGRFDLIENVLPSSSLNEIV